MRCVARCNILLKPNIVLVNTMNSGYRKKGYHDGIGPTIDGNDCNFHIFHKHRWSCINQLSGDNVLNFLTEQTGISIVRIEINDDSNINEDGYILSYNKSGLQNKNKNFYESILKISLKLHLKLLKLLLLLTTIVDVSVLCV